MSTLAALTLSACTATPEKAREPYDPLHDRVRVMVLYAAGNAAPACKNAKVVGANVVDIHSNGDRAKEHWAVDACGTALEYVVTYPQKLPGYVTPGFTIKPKR